MDRRAEEDVLFRAAETVLETAALTWVEAADEECGVDQWEEAIAARMDFGGSAEGFAAIALPRELGEVLATNMLGVEEAQGGEAVDAADAMRELLNMIGMLVTEELLEGVEIAVSPPREIPFADYRRLALGLEPARVVISTEGSHMELMLLLAGREEEERHP